MSREKLLTELRTANELLDKIRKAVIAADKAKATVETAEATVETAKTDLVSRSKAVGLLLLEAKELYPKIKDFKAYLKKVDGLQYSRAADYMRIAGGRTTDAKLKAEARDRKRKSRIKSKSKPAITKPEPVKLAGKDIDVDALGPAARKALADDAARAEAEARAGAGNGGQFVAEPEAARDQSEPAKDSVTVTESPERIKASDRAFRELRVAYDLYMPKMTEADKEKTFAYVEADRASQFKKAA